jgi:hypothetical protein
MKLRQPGRSEVSAVKGSANRSLSGALAVAALLLCALLAPAGAAAAFSLEVTGLEGDASETQALYVEATSGQFRLEFGAGGPGVSETADIDATASAMDVQNALNAIANVSEGGGSVSVVKGIIDPSAGLSPYLVTFNGGPLAMKLQPPMTARNGTIPLADAPPALLGGGPPMAHVTTRHPGGVSRSYERIDYLVKVKNTSTSAVEAAVGDLLSCNGAEIASNSPKNWTPNGFEPTQYDFRWLRNGAFIPGETAIGYTVTAADQGAALQCMVKGTNATAASAWVSLPAQLVGPPSSPPPPGPSVITGTGSRSSVAISGPNRVCSPPTNWTEDHDSNPGTAAVPYSGTWEYQWLRNGEEISGATTNTYTPDTLGADKDTILQCMARAKTGTGEAPGGGGLAVTSPVGAPPIPASVVGTVTNPPTLGTTVASTPSTVFNGAVLSAEVELPSPESYVRAASAGWSCTTSPGSGGEPASAECTSREVQAPGEEKTLTLGIGLGSDLPNPASVGVSVGAQGTTEIAEADSSFDVEPAREFGVMPGFSARALGVDGGDYTQAGGHPALANSTISFWRDRVIDNAAPSGKWTPVEPLRNAIADIPPGFVGNPQAIPDLCPDTAALQAQPPDCPPQSIVGELAIASPALGSGDGPEFKRMALFAIEPEAGAPAQFAAVESFNKGVYVLTPKLRPKDNYAISIESLGVPQNPIPLLAARATLCSYGANVDTSLGATLLRSCKMKGDPGALEKPFLTTQTECAAANPVTKISVDSWADPGDYKTAESLSPKMTGCEQLTAEFEPKLDLQPTTKSAESASGLDVSLTVPSDGLEDPDGLSQAHLKKTTVTLPPGLSVNPSAADGLAACTQAELGMVNGVPNNNPVECPNASKIGTASVETPILEETLEGSVYLAKQGDNPFGTIAALYVVVESKERGILIKLPGRVDFKAGGQIVSTFDDNPQAPFSSLELDFHSGPRATLMTPQKCGNYQIVSKLTPWSAADPDDPTAAETVTQKSGFQVNSGPGGGPCPDGSLQPKLNAGITNPLAGSSSPFVVNLSRPDGSQRFNGLHMTLPPGLAANLRGVPYCSDATLASIPSGQGTGQAQIDNPSCPAASRLGSVSAAAGAGNPIWVNTGKAYLAGPYKGAPLSLAVVIPAVAGPFDLGNVVVRNAITIDPRTAQVRVQSDPIPTHVHNIPVDVRDIRVAIDRPGFMRAPTSCEEMRVDAVVGGEEGALAPISNRFQVSECAALGFEPRTNIRLFGGIARAKYQGVRAVVRPRPGDANISGAVVRFPRSAFVAQEHLKDICTRVQYAAEACPKRSVYGKAVAWSPLLDYPLRGNVYLRSSDNTLPDLVADLRGPAHQPIRIEVSVRNDSVKGALRNTVQTAPDAPVSYFRLQMFGKGKGLIVNSRNICKGRNQARVAMRGHNGRRSVQKVNVFNKRCKAYKRKLRRAKRKAARGKAKRMARVARASRSR